MIDQIIIGNGESYLKAVFNEIDTWYKGNEKTLNIYTVPFNSICIFKEIILKVALMNNRVMYICNDKDKIKKSFNNIFKNQYTSIEKNIVIKEYNSYFKVDDKYELIIYDDIDFEVGTFKIRRGGSAGGHNGIRNIIDNLKTENIQRIRIGISKNEIPLMDYVLGKFTPEEEKKLESIFPKIANVINDFSNNNIDELMKKYNGNKNE